MSLNSSGLDPVELREYLCEFLQSFLGSIDFTSKFLDYRDGHVEFIWQRELLSFIGGSCRSLFLVCCLGSFELC